MENGKIESFLYQAHQKGNVRASQLIVRKRFGIDTIGKYFGLYTSETKLVKKKLQADFTIDTQLMNPERLSDFIIRKTVVPLPKDAKFPFAVINGSETMMFWTSDETYREQWVNAFRSLKSAD